MQQELRESHQVTVHLSPPADTMGDCSNDFHVKKNQTQIPGWPFAWWALSEQEILYLRAHLFPYTKRKKKSS